MTIPRNTFPPCCRAYGRVIRFAGARSLHDFKYSTQHARNIRDSERVQCPEEKRRRAPCRIISIIIIVLHRVMLSCCYRRATHNNNRFGALELYEPRQIRWKCVFLCVCIDCYAVFFVCVGSASSIRGFVLVLYRLICVVWGSHAANATAADATGAAAVCWWNHAHIFHHFFHSNCVFANTTANGPRTQARTHANISYILPYVCTPFRILLFARPPKCGGHTETEQHTETHIETV